MSPELARVISEAYTPSLTLRQNSTPADGGRAFCDPTAKPSGSLSVVLGEQVTAPCHEFPLLPLSESSLPETSNGCLRPGSHEVPGRPDGTAGIGGPSSLGGLEESDLVSQISEDIEMGEDINLATLQPVPLLTIPVVINNNDIRALVDSGATRSLVPQNLISEWKLWWERGSEFHITGLGDATITSLGEILLEFQIQGLTFSCLCLVVPTGAIRHSLILGTDFFTKYSIVVDLAKQKLSGRAGGGS